MTSPNFGGDDDPTLTGDERIVHRARKRYARCHTYYSDAYSRSLDDTKFANADDRNKWQWPDKIYADRDAKKKPCLTINIVQQHNRLVINESMLNKASIRVRPTGGKATVEAAEGMQSLVERTEYISTATVGYRNVITQQVDGGFGFLFLETAFTGKSFDQDVYIKVAPDPRAVYLDYDTKEADGSDAQFGFIFDKKRRDVFNQEHPKFKDKVGTSTLGADPLWIGEGYVLECMYYERASKNDELFSFKQPDGSTFTGYRSEIERDSGTEIADKLIEQIDNGEIDGQYRDVITQEVNWYLIGGDCILKRGDKEKTRWIGEYVPIIPLWGIKTIIEGKFDCKGHTRAQISAQQMLNYNAPLALDTPLPTPNGWTTMGAVKIGDELLGDDGKPCKVVGTSNIHIGRKCYEVTFSDGTSITADDQHLWRVEERGKRISSGQNWSSKTIKTGEFVPKKHFINAALPLELPELDLPVAPYVLGLWLGDGTSKSAEITAGVQDLDEEIRLVANAGHQTAAPRYYNDNTVGVFTILGIRRKLAQLGVLGNKHIPQVYLRASRSQRMALLQGLMDSDGCYAPPTNQCVFINGNTKLVDGTTELLRTLGLKAVVANQPEKTAIFPNGKEYTSKPTFRVSFTAGPEVPVFGLERKRRSQQSCANQAQWRRTKRFGVVSIKEAKSVPVKCVTLDTPSHLFLAGRGMIPTHNSGQVQFGALQSKTPYIGPAKAFETNEEQWKTANIEDYAYLPYDDWSEEEGAEGRAIEKPERQDPPQLAPAFAKGMEDAERWSMMVTGQWQAQQGMQDAQSASSGKAINARQRQGDIVTYHFTEHQYDMYRYLGKQLIGIYPKIYDTKRILHAEGEDLSKKIIQIDPHATEAIQRVKNETDAAEEIIFNPCVGEYEIVSDPGPNYATQRQQTWDALTQLLSQNKELGAICSDLLFKNGDFKGSQEIADRLKKEIRATKPYLFDENADPALLGLQQQLQKATALNSELMTKLADLSLKLRGRDELRDVESFNADTKRMEAEIKALKDLVLTPQQKAQFEHELELLGHQHVYNSIEQANEAMIQPDSVGSSA